MIVTAWSNGGKSYGFKISKLDRDKNFNNAWRSIILQLEGFKQEIEVNIDKESFWSDDCRELIKKEIGQWLKDSGNDKWEGRKPPKFTMQQISDNTFFVIKQAIQ